jgi:hypothetical protein
MCAQTLGAVYSSPAIGDDGNLYVTAGTILYALKSSSRIPSLCPRGQHIQSYGPFQNNYNCSSSCVAGAGVPGGGILNTCSPCQDGTYSAGGGSTCLACGETRSSGVGATECYIDPSSRPSSLPTMSPTVSFMPSGVPSSHPSGQPSSRPTTSYFAGYSFNVTLTLSNCALSDIYSSDSAFNEAFGSAISSAVGQRYGAIVVKTGFKRQISGQHSSFREESQSVSSFVAVQAVIIFSCCSGAGNVSTSANGIYSLIRASVATGTFDASFVHDLLVAGVPPSSPLIAVQIAVAGMSHSMPQLQREEHTAQPSPSPCSIGYYNRNGRGAADCLPCAVGTFKNSPKMAQCQLCSVGMYSSQTASTTCTLCRWPYSTVSVGQSSCVAVFINASDISIISIFATAALGISSILLLSAWSNLSDLSIFAGLVIGSTLNCYSGLIYLVKARFYTLHVFYVCVAFWLIPNAFFLYDIIYARRNFPRILFPWWTLDSLFFVRRSEENPSLFKVCGYEVSSPVLLVVSFVAQVPVLVVHGALGVVMTLIYPLLIAVWFFIGLWLYRTKLLCIDRVADVWFSVWSGSFLSYYTDRGQQLHDIPKFRYDTTLSMKIYLVGFDVRMYNRSLVLECIGTIPNVLIQFYNSYNVDGFNDLYFFFAVVCGFWALSALEWFPFASSFNLWNRGGLLGRWEKMPMEVSLFRGWSTFPYIYEQVRLVAVSDFMLLDTISEFHRIRGLKVDAPPLDGSADEGIQMMRMNS